MYFYYNFQYYENPKLNKSYKNKFSLGEPNRIKCIKQAKHLSKKKKKTKQYNTIIND